MKIAILGAAAGIGSQATQQALHKGYHVTAVSLNPENIPPHHNLNIIKGSATRDTDVARAIAGTDAVLITIGTKQKKGTTLFSELAQAVVSAAESLAYSNPILVVSGFGVGESSRYLSFFMKLVINLFLKDQYKDKARMEHIFAQSALAWEIIHPGILTNNTPTTSYTIHTSLFNGMKVGRIARADVAHYMLAEAHTPKHLRSRVAITY